VRQFDEKRPDTRVGGENICSREGERRDSGRRARFHSHTERENKCGGRKAEKPKGFPGTENRVLISFMGTTYIGSKTKDFFRKGRIQQKGEKRD